MRTKLCDLITCIVSNYTHSVMTRTELKYLIYSYYFYCVITLYICAQVSRSEALESTYDTASVLPFPRSPHPYLIPSSLRHMYRRYSLSPFFWKTFCSYEFGTGCAQTKYTLVEIYVERNDRRKILIE